MRTNVFDHLNNMRLIMSIDATIIAAIISIATVVVNVVLVFYKRFNTLANATESQAIEIKKTT